MLKPTDLRKDLDVVLYSVSDSCAASEPGVSLLGVLLLGVSSVAGVVAVRAGEVVAAGPGGEVGVVGSPVVSGELLSWCVPVVTAPVVVGRDGGVWVDGWLADQVRLGLLEQHVGEGVIE